jgi:DNA-binding winged helix-turn-helix (wHTH) protein
MPKGAFRFSTFELDLDAGELYKRGVRIALQEQPLRVLRTLLERAGEVVTREELHKQFWPDGTFVDFDRGLNTAVNRLREYWATPLATLVSSKLFRDEVTDSSGKCGI